MLDQAKTAFQEAAAQEDTDVEASTVVLEVLSTLGAIAANVKSLGPAGCNSTAAAAAPQQQQQQQQQRSQQPQQQWKDGLVNGFRRTLSKELFDFR